ncbi:hypothetical protein GJ744_005867 [Endocarpon pusillum]|uniref:Glycosyltransferase 2-like domain-containing protein n=1 Tax=Endocarpon pusillum TaxID=364733 RepID=A0A8H7AMI5_9EURO|nr:hypothetical protein GJ744_005867 [Endocarpon pusillum]
MHPLGESEIQHGPYKIKRSTCEPVPLELHPNLFKFSNLISWALWFLYITAEFHLALSVQAGTPKIIWRMWVVLWAEVCLSVQEIILAINTILALFGTGDTRTRPCYRLVGSSTPTVDVFIPCCGEAIDVIIDTVAAAAAQDFPSQRFRVFVLDDGHDKGLQQAVDVLSKQSAEKNGPVLCYLSRDLRPGDQSYFKAGNLRFGIEQTQRLGSSDYLASLDADMIPEPDWLRRMVPHLILDDAVALACPPQRYYNVPNTDPLGQQADFDIWFTIFEPLNDRLDAAMCTGSGFVVKRSALNDIGGWPLAHAGEDLMCSAALSNAGWKVAFVREDLQLGLAPESLRAHVRQRMRWTVAGIEVHKQFGFYLAGSRFTSQMTWVQRGVGLLQALRDYAPVTNVLALVLLPIAIYPVPYEDLAVMATVEGLFWLQSIFLAAFLAHKVNNYIMYAHIGYQRLASFQSMDIYCTPYTASCCLLSLLPSTLCPPTFEVSGTILSPANERSVLRRKPLPYRLLTLDMLIYFSYIIFASIPLGLRFLALTSPDPAESSGSGILFFPFIGALLKLLDAILKAAVPLWYMLYPPTVPERGELMETDEKGLRRPKNRRTLNFRGEDRGWLWTDVLEVGFVCWWLWW